MCVFIPYFEPFRIETTCGTFCEYQALKLQHRGNLVFLEERPARFSSRFRSRPSADEIHLAEAVARQTMGDEVVLKL